MTPKDPVEIPELTPSAPSTADSRRRLLRGGLAAAPVLLTLTSRPVMASGACFPGSVSVSANASRVAAGFSCRGRTASFWSQDASFSEWPAPAASPGRSLTAVAAATAEPSLTAGVQAVRTSGPSALPSATVPVDMSGAKVTGATTFASVFGRQGGYETKTLVEVLRMNASTGRDGLATHLAAAYLNALKGYTPPAVLDVVTIKNIWTSVVARGYYEPTAGIRWFPDYAEPANPRGGLIAWIKTTMSA